MPFTVLHVCVGNICRSPMAERLLALALRRELGGPVDDLYLSHGAGTGSWHLGESMNPPAARQLAARGGSADGFQARQLSRDLIEVSDLVLCATSVQVAAVTAITPDAAARTFVLGEFGRLLGQVDLADLPAATPAEHDSAQARGAALAAAIDARGVALVAAVDARRADPAHPGRRLRPRLEDDLDDPWGGPDTAFSAAADQIERTVVPLAAALTGH